MEEGKTCVPLLLTFEIVTSLPLEIPKQLAMSFDKEICIVGGRLTGSLTSIIKIHGCFELEFELKLTFDEPDVDVETQRSSIISPA